jgi:orotate phosphoribosyltransferase
MSTRSSAAAVLARRIHDRAHLTGEFRLGSGAVSSEYFDKYLFEADPELLREVAEALVTLLPDDARAIAGLSWAESRWPPWRLRSRGCRRFVRKQAKGYGTCRLAEGGDVAGRRLVVVEDVLSSGGAVLQACSVLRELKAEITVVLCVIDGEADGRANLAAEGLELRALFTMSELRRAATAKHVLAPQRRSAERGARARQAGYPRFLPDRASSLSSAACSSASSRASRSSLANSIESMSGGSSRTVRACSEPERTSTTASAPPGRITVSTRQRP